MKIRYEIDPHNRLIVRKSGKESQVPKFRYVLDGNFKVNKNNQLIFSAKTPRPESIPQQLKLSGNWSLDKEHNLVLTLNRENYQPGNGKLTLQGEIIRAKADKLEFLISTKDSGGKNHLYLLGLSGIWQADKYNRLKFLVQTKKDTYDELIFCASWEVNKKNELIYKYIKTNLLTKDKSQHILSFKGYWDISKKQRLLYVLNEEVSSGFDFSVSIAEPQSQGLRYEIGIGIKPSKQRITLFGSWKLNQRLGLIFQMPVEAGRVKALTFGATCKLSEDKQLEFSLKNSFDEDLGIKLKLSRSILKGAGESFLQLLGEGRELSLVAGAGFRW